MNHKSFFLLLTSAFFLSACNLIPSSAPRNPPTGGEVGSTPTSIPPTGLPTTATGTESAKPVQFYTLAQVAMHADPPDDCWIVISDKVYDVSGFATKHPGSEAVYQGCGKDATTLFETRPMGSKTPHSDQARKNLPNFYIGDLTE